MRNNEIKYREELFELLKESFDELHENEINLLKELFLNENLNHEELVNRIKSL